MSTQRQRTEQLQRHVEAALTKPSDMDFPFAEIARQLRIIIADDVTDDEIIMAAYRVRAQWRQYRHVAGARSHLEAIEANCARWIPGR
jgi:hypothetical protein